MVRLAFTYCTENGEDLDKHKNNNNIKHVNFHKKITSDRTVVYIGSK